MTDWQAIISQHSPIAWRTAYRLLGNDADAADCLQETFLSALDVSRREPVRDWSALLRRLATTKAVDRLRQRFRHAKRHEDLSDWTGVPCANPGPTQAAEDAELTAGLRRALASIPAQQATVFCLRCLDELSYEEIAEQLGINANAVGVLLHRARARLQEQMSAWAARPGSRASGPPA